jgi:hypothetical protein
MQEDIFFQLGQRALSTVERPSSILRFLAIACVTEPPKRMR